MTSGGPKSFVWPPPRPQFHRSFQELPTGNNPASTWNPTQGGNVNQAYGFAPQKRQYNWPPNDYQRRMMSSNHMNQMTEHERRTMLELDEVMVVQPHGTVACYRPPPWSQFYKPPYYSSNQMQE